MNKRGILYYPEIYINEKWLKQVILYFDEVSSIFPFDENSYDINTGHYESNLVKTKLVNQDSSYLMYKGIYKPLNPDIVFMSDLATDFENEIKYKFDNELKLREGNSLYREKIDLQSQNGLKMKIHSNKVAYFMKNLFNEYKEYDVIEEDDRWFVVDTKFADIYMSTIAKYMAIVHSKESGNDTIIGSIEGKYKYSISSSDDRILSRKFKEIREEETKQILELNLNQILPVPDKNVSFEEIISYKEEMHCELLEFRKIIRQLREDINSNPDRIHQVTSDYGDDIYVQSKKLLKYNEVNRKILHLEKAKMLCTLSGNVPFIGSISKKVVSPIIECSMKSINKKYLENVAVNKEFAYISEAMNRGMIR